MLISFLLIGVGLALLVKGGDLFVGASIRIAEYLRLPRVVVGSTLVSLTTTTPELVVSLMAGSRGESGLAVGNAVGSCICNVGLILGITAAIKHVDVHPRSLRTPLVAMFACGLLLLLMSMNLSLSRRQGLVLVGAGLAYFAWDFWHHWRDRNPADLAEAGGIEAEMSAVGSRWFQTRAGSAVQFLAGAGIVVVGSRLLVDGAVQVAVGIGIPSIIVGLTVVSVGTSLPELVTAVTSLRRNASDLAVGNVLGANIANLTLIVGAAAALSEVRMSRVTQLFNFTAMLIMFGLLLWMLLSDRQVTRREGVGLLTAYGIYLIALLGLAWSGRI